MQYPVYGGARSSGSVVRSVTDCDSAKFGGEACHSVTAPGGIQAHISSIVASKSARGLNKFYICVQGGTRSMLLIYLSLSVPESGAMPRTLGNFHASICPLADALPPSRSSICSDNQENLYSTLAQASATNYRKKQVARCLGYRGKCEILRCTGEPRCTKDRCITVLGSASSLVRSRKGNER
jgi:hypothetical protein